MVLMRKGNQVLIGAMSIFVISHFIIELPQLFRGIPCLTMEG